jgi:putative DNA primase/helicase
MSVGAVPLFKGKRAALIVKIWWRIDKMKKNKTGELFGINNEWLLTNDKLFVSDEDKDGNQKWNFVCKFIKVINVRQVAETNDAILTLKYFYKGEYRTVNVKRDLLQPNELQKLSRKGIDVLHNNVKSVAQFLRIQEDSAPYEAVHSCVGWGEKDNELYFKHQGIIGNNLPPSTYFGEYNIEPKGTLQGWLDIISSNVIGNKYLELALTFGFSAPVVGLLSKVKDMDSLVVHIYGNSTTGKTTAAQVAVSPFGRPSKTKKGLIKSWSATYNAVVALLRDNYGVPVVLDEASMTKIKDFTPLLYMFSENREKERMTKEGELKEQKSWSTTIISTGEHSLFQKTNENAGLRMRNFEFGNATWTSSAENSNNLKNGLLDHYGHAGILFVQYLLQLGAEKIVKRCEQWKARCEETLPKTEYISRVSEKFGILLATAEMVNETFNLSLDLDSMIQILYDVEEESASERNIADKAYEYIIERIKQHSKYFIIDTQEFKGNECWGRISFRNDELEVSIFPHKFNQLLKEGNYSDPKVVCKEWKEKGYLKSESGKNTNRRKILDTKDTQLRENSGLPATASSKGQDKVYVVVMDKKQAEEYGIRKILSEEEVSQYQRTPKK